MNTRARPRSLTGCSRLNKVFESGVFVRMNGAGYNYTVRVCLSNRIDWSWLESVNGWHANYVLQVICKDRYNIFCGGGVSHGPSALSASVTCVTFYAAGAYQMASWSKQNNCKLNKPKSCLEIWSWRMLVIKLRRIARQDRNSGTCRSSRWMWAKLPVNQ